jgi:hypothetical protein
VIDYDHETAVRRRISQYLVQLCSYSSVTVLAIYEEMFHETANHSLFIQVDVNSKGHRYGGTQLTILRENNDLNILPLNLSRCMFILSI